MSHPLDKIKLLEHHSLLNTTKEGAAHTIPQQDRTVLRSRGSEYVKQKARLQEKMILLEIYGRDKQPRGVKKKIEIYLILIRVPRKLIASSCRVGQRANRTAPQRDRPHGQPFPTWTRSRHETAEGAAPASRRAQQSGGHLSPTLFFLSGSRLGWSFLFSPLL